MTATEETIAPPSLPHPSDKQPLSGDVTTTTAGTDLLESFGILALGLGIVLAFAEPWLLAIVLLTPALLFWAYRRRIRCAIRNEENLRAQQYEFSEAQIQTATVAVSAPGAATAFKILKPGDRVSRWQMETLLKMHMGEAPAAQALPMVLGYAQRLPIKQEQQQS